MELERLVLTSIEPGQSLPSLIANVLRSAIVNGVLKPGESLRQDDLAAHFKVSHIPVREALRQLEIEGLAIAQRHRGVVVSALSLPEIQEIFELRTLLESQALRLAMPKYTVDTFRQAAQLLDDTERESDLSRWGELNSTFHTILYTPANRPRLLSMIANLHHNGDRYVCMKLSVLQCKERTQQEHRQILAACKDDNVELAVSLLYQHIASAGEELVNYLKHEASSNSDL